MTWLYSADEYPSIHGGTFLQDLSANTNFTSGTGVFFKSSNITVNRRSAKSAASGLPYYPSGWNGFKVYVPAGLEYFTLDISSLPNATCRVHTKFKGNDNPLIDHSITLRTTDSAAVFSTEQPTLGYIMKNTISFSAQASTNTYFVSSSFPGGWVYFDVVEDSANTYAASGTVSSTRLNIGYTIKRASDPTVYNTWFSNQGKVSGDPALDISSITIRDLYLADTITDRTYSFVDSSSTSLYIASFSPFSAIKAQNTTFTVTGTNLPSTLSLEIASATCNQISYSGTSVQFGCVPQISGAKAYSLKTATSGTVLKSGIISVTDTDPSTTPISSVLPSSAVRDRNTTFTVTGTNLPSTLDLSITDADACLQVSPPSTTTALFSCIPRVSGTKEYSVKTDAAGEALYYNLLSVTEPAASSSSSGCTITCPTGFILANDCTCNLASSSSSSGCTVTCPTGFVLGSDCTCNLASSSSQGTSSSRSSSSVSSSVCTGSTLPGPGNTTTCSSVSSSLSSSSNSSSNSSSSSLDQNLTSQSIMLVPGWNLISIPIATNDTVDINKTIGTSGATIAWKYNVQTDGNTSSATWEKWLSGGAMTLKSGESIFVGLPGSENKSITFSVKADTNSTRFENTLFSKQTWYLLGYGYATTVGEIKTLYPDSVVWIWENGKYQKLEDNTTTIPAGQGFWFKNKAI